MVHAGGGEAGEGLGVAGPAVQGHFPPGPLWSKRAGASSDDVSVVCGNTAGLTEQGDRVRSDSDCGLHCVVFQREAGAGGVGADPLRGQLGVLVLPTQQEDIASLSVNIPAEVTIPLLLQEKEQVSLTE